MTFSITQEMFFELTCTALVSSVCFQSYSRVIPLSDSDQADPVDASAHDSQPSLGKVTSTIKSSPVSSCENAHESHQFIGIILVQSS